MATIRDIYRQQTQLMELYEYARAKAAVIVSCPDLAI